MGTALWFAGFGGLALAAVLACTRGRARGDDIVGRGVFALAALGAATVIASVAWVWGGADATAARAARIAEGARVILEAPSGERRAVRAGDLLAVGTTAALPGVVRWEPRGVGAVGATAIAVPADPTACASWSPPARPAGERCVVPTAVGELAAFPLVPDGARVTARAARAAIAIGAPAILALAILALLPRRHRRARHLGDALALATVAAGAAALVAWRLYWGYRVDVLRELDAHGPRAQLGELAAVAIGATIAGLAARARPLAAFAAFALALAIDALAVVPGALAHPDAHVIGDVGLALAVVLLVVLAPRVAPRLAERALLRAPELPLIAIAAAAFALRTLAPRFVLGKLALAAALVLAGHAALRTALAAGTPWSRRAWLACGLATAAFAAARFDAGVTLAIAGTGLGIAMLVAGHDAAYDASATARLGVLEREHARLVVVHAGAAALLAIALATAAALASDRDLVAHGAVALAHAPLGAAALFLAAAIVARSHRRGWLPWLAAALACVALWTVRDRAIERATAGDGVGARRVAAVVEPGYALLVDERAFAANASAWRESALPDALAPDGAASADPWRGQGYFGARIRDAGVARSIDNDYLAVLIAREGGVAGLLQTAALLLAIVIAAAALAGARLRHASAAHRARALVAATLCVLVLYQPLAALGVLPLTGISWPGLGLDSPADLWMFVGGIAWLALGAPARGNDTPGDRHDERVRRTPRVARARRLAFAALALGGLAVLAIVARAGACALTRAGDDDARVDAALRYAGSLACPWRERTATTLAELVPTAPELVGTPPDAATARFDRELRARWAALRAPTLATLTACRDDAGCHARVALGWPVLAIAIARADDAGDDAPARYRATCSLAPGDDAYLALRARTRAAPAPAIHVVAAALGIAAADPGELVAGDRAIRLRPTAPPLVVDPAALATAPRVLATRAAILPDGTTVLATAPPRVVAAAGARAFVRDDAGAWRSIALAEAHPTDLARPTLIATPRALVYLHVGADPLVADDGDPAALAGRRIYPYGDALPELGWVNRFDVARSYGLDGWIHAALAAPAPPTAAACGTLAPPPIAPALACTSDGARGQTCRIALQPELAQALRALATTTVADTHAVRAGYVVLRGDTGELLAQGQVAPDRGPLAFPPADAAAEVALVRLLDAPGEEPATRATWNAPIAAGSTFKPILARAAEQVAPTVLADLRLTYTAHAPRCPSRHGRAVDPIYGHCPATSVAGNPSDGADVHDFLAASPNWFQAALGIAGLGLGGDATLAIDHRPLTASALLARDPGEIPTRTPLEIRDGRGAILANHRVVVDGLRRTPLWQRAEALLGRPLCRDCARAAERADTCAARGLPIAHPSAELRALVALGPDRIELPDGAVAEYFQLLRGSGVHPLGSLAQVADAFGRVIYDGERAQPALAASWFPAPSTGAVPAYTCAAGEARTPTVRGAGGGLCAVVQPGGTAYAGVKPLLADPRVAIYGAKTGTSDSLADVARSPRACARWNATHVAATRLTCGASAAGAHANDDSLLVIAFGVVDRARGTTIPITLGLHLQRGGKGSAAKAAPGFVRAIADYLVAP